MNYREGINEEKFDLYRARLRPRSCQHLESLPFDQFASRHRRLPHRNRRPGPWKYILMLFLCSLCF